MMFLGATTVRFYFFLKGYFTFVYSKMILYVRRKKILHSISEKHCNTDLSSQSYLFLMGMLILMEKHKESFSINGFFHVF